MATMEPQYAHPHDHDHEHGHSHDHGHGHDHSQPHPQQPGPPPSMPSNPALTALLDSLPSVSLPFALVEVPIPGAQPPQSGQIVVCPDHKQVVCPECGTDYAALNFMQQFMRSAPSDAIPPPPNMQPPPQRAEMIKNAKEQGNQFGQAINLYSRSADMALSRPPWEPAALGRDETAIAMCNRSAAFAFAGAWSNALADAEAVIVLKRPWTKGHFRTDMCRKARALVGLNRVEDAREALVDGLQFEPNDKELNAFLKEIDEKIASAAEV